MNTLVAIVVGFPVLVVMIVALSAAMAFPTMWLWNGVGPNLFKAEIFHTLDFWNAWGLNILCSLLFKSSSSNSSS